MAESIKKVLYSGIFLTDKSRAMLLRQVNWLQPIPDDWEIKCDHMTLCMGCLPENTLFMEGEKRGLVVIAVGFSEGVIAVKLQTPNRIAPGTPHITVAIDRAGGFSPKDSNNITDWRDIPHMFLDGIVREVTR